MQLYSFQGETEDEPVPSVLSLDVCVCVGAGGQCSCAHLKSTFLLWSCGTGECKLCWLTAMGVLGACPSGESLKSWSLDVCFKPLLFREKMGVGGSFPLVWCCAGSGICGESYLSLSFLFQFMFSHSSNV